MACGGEHEGASPGNGTPPTQDTADAVEAVAAEVRAALPAPGTPPEDRDLLAELQDAVDGVEQLPAVAAAEVHETFLSATIVLRSGLPLVVMNDRPAAGDGASTEAAARTLPQRMHACRQRR
ncbi:MAG: hypothetical protein U5K81_16240 [Trueperaceae bacterium]|nr:hypothetical protein [Trueperaceae bacterium]